MVIPFDNLSRSSWKLKSFAVFSAWEVNLAIDVPAGPVRVLPERMVGGGIKEPVHFYTASPDANFDDKGSKHALHHDKWRRGELTGAEVPAVVAYPCHIEPRKQRFEIVANVHPFDFKSNPPFSTPVSHSLFSDSSLATLTQLKVEAGVEPPFHQGLHREDERIDGSPSSAHTTYLLLELSKRDPSVRSYSFTVFFRVLFRARIALQQGHFPQDPRSWVPWGRPVSFSRSFVVRASRSLTSFNCSLRWLPHLESPM